VGGKEIGASTIAIDCGRVLEMEKTEVADSKICIKSSLISRKKQL
jgi:hypothetical protein